MSIAPAVVPVVPVDGATSPVETASPVSPNSTLAALKSEEKEVLSRSSSLLDMLHLKDVHIPTPPAVK